MDFFDKVKELVKEKNTTIEAVAKSAYGESQASVDKYYGWYKRGLYPRMDDGYALCKALGVSMDSFFEESEVCPRFQKIYDILSGFSDDQLHNVELMLQAMKDNMNK